MSTHCDVPRMTSLDFDDIKPTECLPPQQLRTQNGDLPTCFIMVSLTEAGDRQRGLYVTSQSV
jgi:hypothetical protein